MQPQYVAQYRSCLPAVEALWPHTPALACNAYAIDEESDMVKAGCTQVTHTSKVGQVGRFTLRLPMFTDRRQICRTASRAYWPSVWLPSRRPVHNNRPKKNSSLWSRSPSRLSRLTPASTNNPSEDYAGRAIAPVLITAQRPCFPEGVSC